MRRAVLPGQLGLFSEPEPGDCPHESGRYGTKTECAWAGRPVWTNCREVGRCVWDTTKGRGAAEAPGADDGQGETWQP